ncbi:MAG TPA: rRNA maturation RNase YbeY [Candidatus Faecisoma merdavium]|nr:rRNA maturation RNase YbeY [Candidatus Faecisoma merdavium]
MFEIINETNEEIKEIDTINELLNFVIKKENLENCLFNIIIVDNDYIHKLNKEYRGIDRPTDVISFALEDEIDNVKLDFRVLGDIYISLDKTYEQAKLYNHSFLRELSFLTIHGLLHLLGYDHIQKEDEEVMFKKQDELLNEFGIVR